MDIRFFIKRLLMRTGLFKPGDPCMWNHLPDEKLYEDNFYALSQLPALAVESSGKTEKTIFHSYWHGTPGRKQAFSILSLICTQKLAETEIWIWLDKESGYHGHQENEFLKPLLPFIQIKCFDLQSEFGGIGEWLRDINFEHDLPHKSDAFRFLVLQKYGGVYFDLDIMFVKSIKGLLKDEFCYAWEKQPYANSALLHLKKGSALANYILEKCSSRKKFLPWTILKYRDRKLSEMFVYPCVLFDPVWQGVPSSGDYPVHTFEDFFRKFDDDFKQQDHVKSYADFFKGIYAYHWHNQWRTTEHENSYFGLFEKEFNVKLKDKLEVSDPARN